MVGYKHPSNKSGRYEMDLNQNLITGNFSLTFDVNDWGWEPRP